jgi:hypothetical protein
LKPGIEKQYDPTFWHRDKADRQKDVVVNNNNNNNHKDSNSSNEKRKRKHTDGDGDSPKNQSLHSPLVHLRPMSLVHPDMLGLQMLLLQPLLLHTIKICVTSLNVSQMRN